MANGPKNGKPVAERGADDGVDVLGRSHALLDEIDRFLEQHVLQPVEHKAGFVIDAGGQLARQGYECLNCLDDVLVGSGVRNQLDPRDERRRVGEVHAEEALGVLQAGGKITNRQRRGIAADHSVRTGRLLDAVQHRLLDFRPLEVPPPR